MLKPRAAPVVKWLKQYQYVPQSAMVALKLLPALGLMSESPHHARAVPGNNNRAQKAKLHTKRRRKGVNELKKLTGLYESDNGLIFMVINTFIKHDHVGSTGDRKSTRLNSSHLG